MSEDPEKLERLIDRMLREQPQRSAPPGLETRVMEQIRGRQILLHGGGTADPKTADRPWWRRNFTHWPLPARVGFLIASYGFARLAIVSVAAAAGALNSGGAVGPALSWLQVIANLCSAIAATGDAVIRSIPPDWLYVSAAFGAVLYLSLVGLGTVAYRTLYIEK